MEKENDNSELINLFKSYLLGFDFKTINSNDKSTDIQEQEFFHYINQFLKNFQKNAEKRLKDAPQGNGPKFVKERAGIEKEISRSKEAITKINSLKKKLNEISSDSIIFSKKTIYDNDVDTPFGSYSYVHDELIIWDKANLIGVQIEKFEGQHFEEREISHGS